MLFYSFIINGNKRFIKQKLRPFNHKTGHHCDDRLAVISSYKSNILLCHYLRPVSKLMGHSKTATTLNIYAALTKEGYDKVESILNGANNE